MTLIINLQLKYYFQILKEENKIFGKEINSAESYKHVELLRRIVDRHKIDKIIQSPNRLKQFNTMSA